MTTTRDASLDDIPLLVDLMQAFYAESDYPLDRQWATKSFSALLGDPSLGAVMIAFHGDEPAGYVVLTVRHSMEVGGLDAFIDDLFVHPVHRRKRLGRALLDELFAACERRGVRAVHVEVAPSNVAARALYGSKNLRAREDERLLLTVRLG